MLVEPTRTRSRLWLLVPTLAASSILALGCGPITFQGGQAFAVAGDLPPPPPPPEPEPTPEPAPPPKRVELRDNKIVINEKIQFELNKAVIKEASFDLLSEIAKVIKENPHIRKIRIEGHASSEGDDKYNLKLSDKRAKAVMKHLVDKDGIAAGVLMGQGFGETKPIATNDTEEGRETNRRVEFNVVEQDVTQKKVEIDPATGKERVVEEQTHTDKKADAVAPAEAAAPPAAADESKGKKGPKAMGAGKKGKAAADAGGKADGKADKADKADDKAADKPAKKSGKKDADKSADKKAAKAEDATK